MAILEEFKGKIITIGRNSPGPEYANDFIIPDGVRKEIAYVDDNLHLNYINGLCADNSPAYMCGFCSQLEQDVERKYNTPYIREVNSEELEVYIKEVRSYFNAILSEKGRPPIARFPLPIIDKVKMSELVKSMLINEQK